MPAHRSCSSWWGRWIVATYVGTSTVILVDDGSIGYYSELQQAKAVGRHFVAPSLQAHRCGRAPTQVVQGCQANATNRTESHDDERTKTHWNCDVRSHNGLKGNNQTHDIVTASVVAGVTTNVAD